MWARLGPELGRGSHDAAGPARVGKGREGGRGWAAMVGREGERGEIKPKWLYPFLFSFSFS